MPRVIVEQLVKEKIIETEVGIEREDFTYIVKFERAITPKETKIKISFRDLKKDSDYTMIHESKDRKDYNIYMNFFKKNGYVKI